MTDVPALNFRALRGNTDTALTAVLDYLTAGVDHARTLPLHTPDHWPSPERGNAYSNLVNYLIGVLQNRLGIEDQGSAGQPAHVDGKDGHDSTAWASGATGATEEPHLPADPAPSGDGA